MTSSDTIALWELQQELNMYILYRLLVNKNVSHQIFLTIQDYFTVTRATHTEKSEVAYLKVMDAVADSKDTIMLMLHDLHQKYIVEQNRQWLLVEGDNKVYEILQALKYEYGEELQWVLPYPVDWHLLKNYQYALIKPYFDAGLKALAKAAGYPVAAIQSCG